MSELVPTPEPPDDTPLERVRFPSRIRNVFSVAGLRTVGQVRETSDPTPLSFPDLGPGSVAHIRKALGPFTKVARTNAVLEAKEDEP